MFELKVIIGIITVILGVVGYIPYLRDVIRGTTRPHIYTWFVWGLVTIIIFALQVSDNAGAGAWVTLVAGLLSLSIFLLGLKQGDRDITLSDTLFFVVALIALALWLIIDEAVLAIIILVTVGMLGFIPTIRKSWNRPETETVTTYGINAFRHLLSVAALSNFSILTLLFPIAWGLANSFFVVMILLRRKIKRLD